MRTRPSLPPTRHQISKHEHQIKLNRNKSVMFMKGINQCVEFCFRKIISSEAADWPLPHWRGGFIPLKPQQVISCYSERHDVLFFLIILYLITKCSLPGSLIILTLTHVYTRLSELLLKNTDQQWWFIHCFHLDSGLHVMEGWKRKKTNGLIEEQLEHLFYFRRMS